LKDTNPDYEAKMVLDTLLEDVEKYTAEAGIVLDFVFVTGDLAFSGKSAEYESVKRFFDELCKVTRLDKSRFLVVPGNHDVDRTKVTPGAKIIGEALQNNDKVHELFEASEDRKLVLRGLSNYGEFVNNYFKGHLCFNDEHFFFVKEYDVPDGKLSILGLNSAWLSLSDNVHRDSLLIGKPQVTQAIGESGDADVRIALLHHSFDYLRDFDRLYVERTLRRTCDFILHGHLHDVQVRIESTIEGLITTVPAGACYMGSEYANSYNLAVFDPKSHCGIVHLRRYSPQLQQWTKDIDSTGDNRNGRVEIDLSRKKTQSMPVLTLSQYNEIVTSFRLLDHLNDKLKVGDSEIVAEDYYMARIEEMENFLIKSFDMQDIPLLSLFEQYEEIAYNGAIRKFKPLQDFIRKNAPSGGKQLSDIEIDKASLAFSRLLIDRYLRKRHRLDNFLRSLEIENGPMERPE
jgi:UDP-2,3-diacylglucosamine pyrophosphatase LpxH